MYLLISYLPLGYKANNFDLRTQNSSCPTGSLNDFVFYGLDLIRIPSNAIQIDQKCLSTLMSFKKQV